MTDVTDDFNRADGGLGSNWTTMTGTVNIAANVAVQPSVDVDGAARWSANTFPNNQYAQCKVVIGPVGEGAGPAVRMGGTDWYFFFSDTGGTAGYMLRWNNGSPVLIGSTYSTSIADGDTLRLEVSGTTLSPFHNGTPLATRTDGNIASGSPGFHIFDNLACSVDDWLGGPITAVTTDGVGSATGTAAASAIGSAISILTPDADITDGGWLTDTGGTSLFAAIDETVASDTDYIVSGTPDTDMCEIRLSDPGMAVARPFSVAYRYKRIGTDTPTLRVQLMEGATSRASWDVAVSVDSFTDTEQFLTAPEFASITDFTDLRVRFTAIRESALGLEGDFSGSLTLEGDFSGSLLLEGT